MKKQTFSIFFFLGIIGMMFVLFEQQKRQHAVLTVYVHGTLFNWRNMLAYIPGAAELTYVPDGLSSVKDLDQNTVGNQLAQEFSSKDPKRFVYDNFYTFGWSGKLSFEQRKKSAEFLAQELQKVLESYQLEHGVKPIVRIVTFSHGGNVALNLAHFLPNDIQVELILIACPIQKETEILAEAFCFSKIYTIYSLNDVVQVADPQKLYRNIRSSDGSSSLLSRRSLQIDDDKIKQACVSVNGTYLGHLELFQLFNKHIPMVLNRLDALSEVSGKTIAYIDVPDKSFRFLNGLNVIDVLKGHSYDDKSDQHDENL